jgi:hypothetical protein
MCDLSICSHNDYTHIFIYVGLNYHQIDMLSSYTYFLLISVKVKRSDDIYGPFYRIMSLKKVMMWEWLFFLLLLCLWKSKDWRLLSNVKQIDWKISLLFYTQICALRNIIWSKKFLDTWLIISNKNRRKSYSISVVTFLLTNFRLSRNVKLSCANSYVNQIKARPDSVNTIVLLLFNLISFDFNWELSQ